MEPSVKPMIRCTVHWYENDQAKMQDLSFVDRPVGDLIPALRQALGLAGEFDAGVTSNVGLRLAPRLPAWPEDQNLTSLGVRDGYHIWLTSERLPPASLLQQGPTRYYTCAIKLPGLLAPVLLPAQGLDLTRSWLLQQLPLNIRLVEQFRLLFGRSRFQAVLHSSPHCFIRQFSNGTWVVATARTDVNAYHNGKLLPIGIPVRLVSGDMINLGAELGPSITVILDSINDRQ